MRKAMLFWFYNGKEAETAEAVNIEQATKIYRRRHPADGNRDYLVRFLGKDGGPRLAAPAQKSAKLLPYMPPNEHSRGSPARLELGVK